MCIRKLLYHFFAVYIGYAFVGVFQSFFHYIFFEELFTIFKNVKIPALIVIRIKDEKTINEQFGWSTYCACSRFINNSTLKCERGRKKKPISSVIIPFITTRMCIV